ncbi:MAG: 8-amino-7-oxononanoate synthase [Acidobacteria bacterium]|nr:8-amino-7-oxononanoate synthase [Acidobacteriota bacterium]
MKETSCSSPTAWTRRLELWRRADLERTLSPASSSADCWARRRGGRLLNLASNNYLGLASDTRVVQAARKAMDRWGVGAGGSRLLSGDTEAHHDLETELAELKGTEASLVFASGYAANVGVLSALASARDELFLDTLCHASLVDGARLSGAKLHPFPHRDLGSLEKLLDAAGPGGRFVVTDTVFSMDADLAPLPALVSMTRRHRAALVVDDAHGTGVIGREGRGAPAYMGVAGEVPVTVGTLSKALGVQGGFVAGSRDLIRWLVNRSRSFVYSTGLAPALAAAALEAVRIMRKEEWRRERQQRHMAQLRAGLGQLGYSVLHEPPAPMLLVMTGNPRRTLRLANHLEERGVLVSAVRWPTVAKGACRIRLAAMATHTEAEIEAAVDAFPPASKVPDA